MKRTTLFLFALLLAQFLYAQKATVKEYAAIDKKALLLPDSLTKTTESIASYVNLNFKSETEKSRAIFIWIASNIQYDVDNMFAINFDEKTAEKISKPLKSRKGICENYAALFNDICSKTGIKSFVIQGYTRVNGVVNTISHAWCAARIDSSWFLFDPTWGSGFVNDSKYVKKINNSYFKVNPAVLISSHMPFDYLWQFSNYPVTNQEFYEGKTRQNNLKPFFSFADSLKVYESLNHLQQLEAASYRIEKNGVKNSMIFDILKNKKIEIENIKSFAEYEIQNRNVNFYNLAVVDFNDGINFYNAFIRYQNVQFTPIKPDPEIQNMLDITDSKYKDAKIKLDSINKPDANLAVLSVQLTKSIEEAATQLREQQDWLQKYFAKSKLGRKSMFYEWSGKQRR